jgi:glycosyltransferase involved in cell wall biosynthesis
MGHPDCATRRDRIPPRVVPTCSIFIPSYQAAGTIEAVIDRIPAELWDSLAAVHVVNDGSTDDTNAVVERIAAQQPKVVLHSQDVNRGYGAAVRRGLQLALEDASDYVVCLHADGQYPPEKLPEFLPFMAEHGVDVLQGSRHKDGTALAGGMPRYKVIAGRILTWLENRTFGLEMTDYHSGFMLYSRKAVEQIPFDQLSTYFDFDLEVIASARARGLSVAERGIPTRYADEESHLNPIWYGLRCLRVMLRFRLGAYRP